jgi:hypothetical protein
MDMNAMPWTHELMTDAEFAEWVASRKEAGQAINIETCELGSWYADDMNPYDDQSSEGDWTSRHRFVRAPESRGWVHEGDLPPDAACALCARMMTYRMFRTIE